MNIKIRSIDQFKIVMAAILAVNAEYLTMETNIDRFVEVFNALEEHEIEVRSEKLSNFSKILHIIFWYNQFNRDEMILAYHLKKRCVDLKATALQRATTLKPTREVFAEQKTIEIDGFALRVSSFVLK